MKDIREEASKERELLREEKEGRERSMGEGTEILEVREGGVDPVLGREATSPVVKVVCTVRLISEKSASGEDLSDPLSLKCNCTLLDIMAFASFGERSRGGERTEHRRDASITKSSEERSSRERKPRGQVRVRDLQSSRKEVEKGRGP